MDSCIMQYTKCAVALLLILGISLTQATSLTEDENEQIANIKALHREKRQSGKLDTLTNVIVKASFFAETWDSRGGRVQIPVPFSDDKIDINTGPLYGSMSPVLFCLNLICGPMQTLHGIPEALRLIKTILSNVKDLIEIFDEHVLGFLDNLAKPLRFILFPVRQIIKLILVPALEITVNLIKGIEPILKTIETTMKPFHDTCGLTKATLLATSGYIKLLDLTQNTNFEQNMLSTMDAANDTCWNIVDHLPLLKTEWVATLQKVVLITTLINPRRAKTTKRDTASRARRQLNPLLQQFADDQQTLYNIGPDDLFMADDFLGKPAIAIQNGVSELGAIVGDLEPITTKLENVKTTLNEILDKELCIDFTIFGEALEEALGVAVDVANEIVDAARRITIDDIENAAVLVKRNFQEVGDFLRGKLADIGKTEDDIGDVLTDIGDGIVDAGETVVDGVKVGAEKTVEFGKDAAGAIVDTGEKAADLAVDTGKTLVGGVEKGAEKTVEFFSPIGDFFGRRRRKRQTNEAENIPKNRNARQVGLSVDDASILSEYFKDTKICISARIVLEKVAALFDTIFKPFELLMNEALEPIMGELKEFFEDITPDSKFIEDIQGVVELMNPGVNFPSLSDLENIVNTILDDELVTEARALTEALNPECTETIADFVTFPSRVTVQDLNNKCSSGTAVVIDPRRIPIFDCVKTPFGLSYKGQRAVTASGVDCLPWTLIADALQLTDADFKEDASVAAAENFCRNPTSDPGGPWCPISETETETCRLPICEPGKSPSKECLLSDSGVEYQGTADTTVTAIPCMRWDQVDLGIIDAASVTLPVDFDKGTAENYCRNPAGIKAAPFCFVEEETLYEDCQIAQCEPGCKETAQGSEYTGTVRTTVNGLKCQRWGERYPHNHGIPPTSLPERSLNLAENFCRNPDRDPGGPWCFTTDPDTVWEYCDIPFCNSSIAFQGTVRMPDVQFKDDFNNINSPASRAVSDSFCANMDQINIDQFGDKYKGCTVKSLQQGSLIINYEIYWKKGKETKADLAKIARKMGKKIQKRLKKLGNFAFGVQTEFFVLDDALNFTDGTHGEGQSDNYHKQS